MTLLLSLSTLGISSTDLPAPEVKAQSPKCEFFVKSNGLALLHDITSSDITCNAYGQGYIEGIFDAGIGIFFRPPPPGGVKLSGIMSHVTAFMIANQDKLEETEARYVVVLALRQLYGEVKDADTE